MKKRGKGRKFLSPFRFFSPFSKNENEREGEEEEAKEREDSPPEILSTLNLVPVKN